MRKRLRQWLLLFESKLRPPAEPRNLEPIVRDLSAALLEQTDRADLRRQELIERAAELQEAHAMQGAGPWLSAGARMRTNESKGDEKEGPKLRESLTEMLKVSEAFPVGAIGSTGDIELALQNVDWRRDVQLSWLEFSRWGIQQIILICRLYYIKHPIIRRLTNVDAYYVFGRGVEISSTDKDVNAAIEEFQQLNRVELSQPALIEHQKRTSYDGNLFFMFFPDTQSSGTTKMRCVDATEIMDIITNPDDSSEEWYFRRTWAERYFDIENGATQTRTHERWYPSINYQPVGAEQRTQINGYDVEWKTPIQHRKYGSVGKWLFGCPTLYPAIDWAKAARRYLEACMTLAQSLAQFSLTLTTKGGPQALAGVKQQLQTTVGPTTQVFDTNPTANNASIFSSGPGTKLEAFHSRSMALDPSEYRPIATMAAIAMDVPPTWIGDMETSNLATALTLDRPTELAFMSKQENWRDLFIEMYLFALNVNAKAPKGKLREAIENKFGKEASKVRFVEAPKRIVTEMGASRSVYLAEAERKTPQNKHDLEIRVDFPAIREGDIPQMVTALVEAMTLGNKGGQVVGIDEKAAVLKLMEFFNIEEREKLIEEMYPTNKKGDEPAYDPNRTIVDDSNPQAPISTKPPFSAGGPQAPGGKQTKPQADPTPGQESLYRRLGTVGMRLVKLAERKRAA